MYISCMHASGLYEKKKRKKVGMHNPPYVRIHPTIWPIQSSSFLSNISSNEEKKKTEHNTYRGRKKKENAQRDYFITTCKIVEHKNCFCLAIIVIFISNF